MLEVLQSVADACVVGSQGSSRPILFHGQVQFAGVGVNAAQTRANIDDSSTRTGVPKGRGDDPGRSSPERIDAMEYVARMLSQIPEPRKHQVRYYVARVVM